MHCMQLQEEVSLNSVMCSQGRIEKQAAALRGNCVVTAGVCVAVVAAPPETSKSLSPSFTRSVAESFAGASTARTRTLRAPECLAAPLLLQPAAALWCVDSIMCVVCVYEQLQWM